ncbi:hypothetical protein MCEMRE185_01486 [Candidatus Nanopelagicaceae bacterium]
MRRNLAALVLIAAIITPLSLNQASAATPVIRITDKPHTGFDGKFRDNELATSLLPDGKLGKLVSSFSNAKKTWVIDSALIAEIADMSDGYSFDGKEDKDGETAAKNWLARLTYSIGNSPVIALPFGNPDQSLAKRLAPSELNFYSAYAKEKLELQLGRAVKAENGWSKGSSGLAYPLRSIYTSNRQALTGLSSISTSEEIRDLRARLALIMNPDLDRVEQSQFSYASVEAVKKMMSKLRVSPGRYQLTSTSAKLPVTLINDFDTPTVVSLSLSPQNSRMQLQDIKKIELAANSRQQLSIPVEVLAPGSTVVVAQFMNVKGQLVGEESKLELNATIIDSRVAWFTTAAAIFLFLGAVTQSVHRIRRGRK